MIVKSGSPRRKSPSRKQGVVYGKKRPRKVRKAKKASNEGDDGAGRRAKIERQIALQDEKRRAAREALMEAEERLRELRIALAKASEPIGYLLVINDKRSSNAILPLAVDVPVSWDGLIFEVSKNLSSFMCASDSSSRRMSYDIPFNFVGETRLMIGPVGALATYKLICFANERDAKRFLAQIRSAGP